MATSVPLPTSATPAPITGGGAGGGGGGAGAGAAPPPSGAPPGLTGGRHLLRWPWLAAAGGGVVLIAAAAVLLVVHSHGGGGSGGGASASATNSATASATGSASGSGAGTAPDSGFTSNATVAVGAGFEVRSSTPCPPLQAGWKNRDAVVYLSNPSVTNPDGSKGVDLVSTNLPTQADGSWSGAIAVPDGTPTGDADVVRVTCDGEDPTGSSTTYFFYPARNPIAVTR